MKTLIGRAEGVELREGLTFLGNIHSAPSEILKIIDSSREEDAPLKDLSEQGRELLEALKVLNRALGVTT